MYEIKPLRAWGAVATTLASMAGCLWLIAQAPWYMLPFAWALAGTAFTGVRGNTGVRGTHYAECILSTTTRLKQNRCIAQASVSVGEQQSADPDSLSAQQLCIRHLHLSFQVCWWVAT